MSFTTVYFLRRRLFFDDSLAIIEALFDPIHVTFKSSAFNPFSMPYGVTFENVISSFKCNEMKNPLSEPFTSTFDDIPLDMNLLAVNPIVASVKIPMSDFLMKNEYDFTLISPTSVKGKINFTGDVFGKVGNIHFTDVKIDNKSIMDNRYRILLMDMMPTSFSSIYNFGMDFKSPELVKAYYFDKFGINLGEIESSYKFDFISTEPAKIKEKAIVSSNVSLSMLKKIPLSHYTQKTLSELSEIPLSDMKYYLLEGEKL